MPRNSFLTVDKRILAEAGTTSEVRRNLFTLCDQIGPRFTGTSGYRRAAEFMREQFEVSKLDGIALEPFEFMAWRRGEPAELSLVTPVERTYPCYEMPYGAATGSKGVKAMVVDIGGGSQDEVSSLGRRLRGRLALTDGSSGHRTGIYERCVSAGAVGLIISNSTPGMMLQTGSVGDGSCGPIPVVNVPFESGQEIRRLGQRSTVRMHLATHGTCEQATTWNVVGELKGTERPEELVLMGGHLDSHDIGPCAFDNAAGAVMVMEAARLLAKQRKHLRRTVRFIGFAGEELGLLGSHHYARSHAAELRRARFMLNCDTPALGRPRGLAFHGCPKGAAYVAKLSEEMGTELLCQNREHCHSDHYPFILQGVPTAGIAGGPSGSGTQHFVHMAADTPEKICLDDLRDAAAFAARVLLRASSDEHWPRMRRGASEVKVWRARGVMPKLL